MASAPESVLATIQRLVQVTNAHDLEGIVACFSVDYALESPLHPARSFRGQAQVRRNWTEILAGIPDIKVSVVRAATDDASAWTEWEMTGTRLNGQPHLMRGVFIFGIREGLIGWGRMFLEPVDQSPSGVDALPGSAP